ncbi:hypothetical protein [Domibacillus epiphyticus]|uniref:Competence protein ComG n=1 Tax=Domibacillus epiphyticus TaxID=1714355 RepID=A0A1V2A9R8_9BACI|nr:hypothetical protein [Domibacillus epiphyticus]OMP67690.1 hypothetical protein BTO28_07040 [Domibacillus epiphyticus]
MIYPHVLLLLFLVSAAAVIAAEASVTKINTANQLTEYYELRIIELMAIRNMLENPDAPSFSMETNKGTTMVQITDSSATERRIRITTYRTGRPFYSTFFYNKAEGQITKRTEHF